MGLWAGGLVMLVAALPRATRVLEPAGRTRLLAGTLARFSPLALSAVIVLTIAGVLQAIFEVHSFPALLDTAFGRAVLIKAILLCGLIAIGVWHRRSSIPGLRAIAAAGASPAAAGVAVRRALRAEVALIVAVLGVTAALSSYPPSTVQTSGPFSQTTTVGPAQLQITVDPATVGANDIHLYLLNPSDGSQWDKAKEVRLTASEADKGIGPLSIDLSKAGPGHYTTSGPAALAVPGDWTLDVAVRVSDFDQYERQIEVPIR
jgi:copper transport protein